MATLGNTATPGSGFYFDDTGNSQYWTVAGTMPSPGGYATEVYVYFGGDGAAVSCKLAIWGVTALLWSSSTVTQPSGSRSVGGQSWGHVPVPNLYIPSGTVLNLGIWTSGNVVWTYEPSGSVAYQRGIASGPTTLASQGTEGSGNFGAYIVYTPLTAPTISNVSPNVAPAGSVVTLTGTGFLHASGITVCGVTASTYTINSDTSITLTIPTGAGGAGNIVVTNPAGTGSIAFTAGQLYWGDASGNGAVHTPVAVWYGDPSGNGTPHKIVGIWVPNGAGVKRIW